MKKGGSVDAQDVQGDTPLHWAARQGHAHIIVFLIEQGAQINAQNKVSSYFVYIQKCKKESLYKFQVYKFSFRFFFSKYELI